MTDAPKYGLRLAAVRVEDFRSLRDVGVEFSRGTTVLIGENNSGKTSLLESLSVAFGQRRPRAQDLYSGPSGAASKFVVDLRIETGDGSDFPDSVRDVVGNGLQLEEPEFFALRVTGALDAEGWDINLTRTFIKGWAQDRASAADIPAIDSPSVSRDVLSLLHFDMLDARRDIVEQLRNRRTYWGRTTSNVSIAADVRAELESSLQSLGQQVTSKSPVLSRVRDDLGFLSEALSSGKLNVELEALPRNVDDLIRAMDVVITSTDSSPFSVESHGMGTRSLAALLVFRSYVNVVRPRGNAERLMSVAAFEEPEAHLHPQAQRSVFDLLAQIGGQRIVSTHSAHVASIADIESYRIFRRQGPATRVSAVPPVSWNTEQMRRFVQLENPEILFAKAVGIVEGQTERLAFPVFARSWWGLRGADGQGVSLICTGGAGNAKHIVPLLDTLGIPWVIFCDADSAGVDGLEAAGALVGRSLTASSPEVVMLPSGQSFEDYIIGEGYLAQACAAADRHPKGPLAAYMARNEGNKRHDQSIRNYSGADGQRLGCYDLLKSCKSTIGALLAEELMRPIGDPPVAQFPSRVREFFVRLDNAKS